MREYYYIIKEIPDLSLAKYSGIDNSGTSGVIDRHTPFLKQLHTIGMLKNTSFHLFYIMDSKKEKGHRLTIAVMCRTGLDYLIKEVPDYAEQEYYLSLLNSTSLCEFFIFEPAEESILPNKTFVAHAFLSRSASVINSSSDNQTWTSDKPYCISKWKENKSGRLYNVLKLIEKMNSDVVYRVDLYPVDYSDKISSETAEYMTNLKQRASFRAPTGIQDLGMTKDEAADNAHRRLKEYIEIISEATHFAANITVLHNDAATARIILEYAASETIDEGGYKTDCVQGTFNCRDNMDAGTVIKAVDGFEKFRFMQTLYTVGDIKGFFSLPVLFDNETLELRKESDPKLTAGDIFMGTNSSGYPVYLPLEVFTKHAYISGVPGSGKTYTMKHLITSLWTNKVPFLIFEPAKREYRGLFEMKNGLMKDMMIFSPSAGTRFPLKLNPFEIPKGITVSEHISNIISVFEGAFDLQSPLPFLLNNSIERIYERKGWKFFNKGGADGEKRKYPLMSEVYAEIEMLLESTDYGEENKGNLKAMLQTRLGSLLTRERGDVFDAPESSLRPEQWIELPVLIELESLGEGPANFVTLLITTLIRETLKANPVATGKRLRHVIFFEEAHNLIGPVAEKNTESADAKAASTKFIVDMLAEVRALKEGIVIADQLPSSIAPQVLKNTGLKLAHRQMSAEERSILGQVMSADSVQIERLAKYTKGLTLMTYEGTQGDEVSKPFEVQIQPAYRFSSDSPDDERLAELLKGNKNRIKMLDESMRISIDKALEECTVTLSKAIVIEKEILSITVKEDESEEEKLRKRRLYTGYASELKKLCENHIYSYNKFAYNTTLIMNDMGKNTGYIHTRHGCDMYNKILILVKEIRKFEDKYPLKMEAEK